VTTAIAPTYNRPRAERQRSLRELTKVSIVGILLLILDIPILWLVLTSFRPTNHILTNHLASQFKGLTAQAYGRVFATFSSYMLNSMIDCLAGTAIVLVVATCAAYSVTRRPQVLQRATYGTLLIANVFPYVVVTLPIYVIFSHTGLLDTYEGIILAYAGINTPVATLLLVAFMSSVPRELDEAASLDGAGPVATLVRVIVPSVQQGVFVAGTISFVNMWQDFILANVIITSPGRATIPLGLNSLFGQYSTQWNEVMALSAIATIPTFLLFLGLQGRLTSGLLTGAIK